MFDGIVFELWLLIIGVFGNLIIAFYNNYQNINLKKKEYSIQLYDEFCTILFDIIDGNSCIKIQPNDAKLLQLKRAAFKIGNKNLINYCHNVNDSIYEGDNNIMILLFSLFTYAKSFAIGKKNVATPYEYISLILNDKEEIAKIFKLYQKYKLNVDDNGEKILNKLLIKDEK